MSAQTVVGIFNTATEAQQAVQKLEQAGFKLDYVDVAHREAANQGMGRTSDDSIGGFFSSLFGGDDSDDARNYTEAAKNGSSVVTVHVDSTDQSQKAARILDDAGAVDVDGGMQNDKSGNNQNYQRNQMNQDNQTNQNNQNNQTGDNMKAEVIEESLQVGKRMEQTGGVRLRSRIVEKPVEASVRLREEHVTVQRTPVDRPASDADFKAFKEGEMEITESAERAVVAKEAHVVEEVSLGKQVTEREEVVRDTVRNTEVDVEQIPGKTNTTNTTNTDNMTNKDYQDRNQK